MSPAARPRPDGGTPSAAGGTDPGAGARPPARIAAALLLAVLTLRATDDLDSIPERGAKTGSLLEPGEIEGELGRGTLFRLVPADAPRQRLAELVFWRPRSRGPWPQRRSPPISGSTART